MKQLQSGELVRLTDSHGTELSEDKPYVVEAAQGDSVKLIGYDKEYSRESFSRMSGQFWIGPMWLFIIFAFVLAIYSLMTAL